MVGVVRGILSALWELVKVGKRVEEGVLKWGKENIEYRGRWLRKEEKEEGRGGEQCWRKARTTIKN